MAKVITVKAYADKRGCSTKNVYNQIYAGRQLPGVRKVERQGKSILLHVDENKFGLQL